MSINCQTRIEEQLADILNLPDGWDEDCKAFRRDEIHFVQVALESLLGELDVEPNIFAVYPHDISVEWTSGDSDLDLRIAPAFGTADFRFFVRQAQLLEKTHFDLRNPAELATLRQLLKRISN